ncbi:MAG: DUF5723 family protein [Bacteroidota bacterium]
MFRNIFTTFSLLLLTAPIFAQQELGLHFLRNNWHANETNPAIVMDKGGVFRLPGLYNGLTFDGPSYSQLVTKVNGEPVIDVNTVINYLNDENIIKNDFQLQTIGFAVPIKKKFIFSFGHAVKYHAFFKYPKELAQVIYEGNAQFIGQTIDIGNELQLSGYHSVDMGLAYKWKEFTFGVKAKFLSGFVDITTDPQHKSIDLYTDPDIYQLTLEGDYILHSANALEYRSYDDFDYDLNFGTFTADKFFDGNTGWAFDLGLHYQKDKWDVAVSAVNLSGGINWKTRVTNFKVQDSYEYNGLDFSNALTGGASPDFQNTLDSLEAIFQPVQTEEAYTNNIPRQIYVSGMYQVKEKWQVGAVFFNEEFRGVARNSFGLHTNYDLAEWFNFGLTYSANGDTFDNVGGSMTFHGKSFQLFAISDNVIDLINPTQGNAFAIRLGGNLFF